METNRLEFSSSGKREHQARTGIMPRILLSEDSEIEPTCTPESNVADGALGTSEVVTKSSSSNERVRKTSVIDSMPLQGTSGCGVGDPFGDCGLRSPIGLGFGLRSSRAQQSGSRSRASSDDSVFGNTTSPASIDQPSPIFQYPTNSFQSSSSSPDASASVIPQKTEASNDVVEHPLEQVRLELEAASGRRHRDETDAAVNSKEECLDDIPAVTNNVDESELVEAHMTSEPGDEEYSMGYPHRRRRIASIFNNDKFSSEDERIGSAADVQALKSALEFLDFNVQVHPNLTRTQIADELDILVKADLDDCECFCLAVLTHGEAPDLLHAKDGIYRQNELWMPFIGDKCAKLAGKPKLFLVQACRGDGREKGVRLVKYSNTSQTDASAKWSYVIPTWADFLIAHSCVEGFVSWRNPEDGTWWIQTLCEELVAKGKTTNLLKILTIVNRRVALEFESYHPTRRDLCGCKEMPSFTSTLTRDLIFRPLFRRVQDKPHNEEISRVENMDSVD